MSGTSGEPSAANAPEGLLAFKALEARAGDFEAESAPLQTGADAVFEAPGLDVAAIEGRASDFPFPVTPAGLSDAPQVSEREPKKTGAADEQAGQDAGPTPLEACVLPWLRALGWEGQDRHLAEARPYGAGAFGLSDLKATMGALGYRIMERPARLDRVMRTGAAVLFIPKTGSPLVVLARDPGAIRVFHGEEARVRQMPLAALEGRVLIADRVRQRPGDDQLPSALRAYSGRSSPLAGLPGRVLAATALGHLFTLAVPLFLMLALDKVVPSGGVPGIAYLGGITLTAVGIAAFLFGLRGSALSRLWRGWAEAAERQAWARALVLREGALEGVRAGRYRARLEGLEAFRAPGPAVLAARAADVLMVPLYALTLTAIAGPLAGGFLVGAGFLLVAGAVVAPLARARERAAAAAEEALEAFREEASRHRQTILARGAMTTFDGRHEALSTHAAATRYQASQMIPVLEAIGRLITGLTALGVLLLAISGIVDGTATAGAVLAAVVLTLLGLTPLAAGLAEVPEWARLRMRAEALDGLFDPPEGDASAEDAQSGDLGPPPALKGALSLDDVGLTYPERETAALSGISVGIDAREFVVIVGSSGSGKSTLLRIMAGLQAPTEGDVRIDGTNLYLFEPSALRHAVGYAPSRPWIVSGTLGDNLRLADPVADEDTLLAAAGRLGLGDRLFDPVPDHLQDAGRAPSDLAQRITLARALLGVPPLMLFNAPLNGLAPDGRRHFAKALSALKGQATIVIAASSNDFVSLADKIIWVDGGTVRAFGPPEDVLKHVPPETF